MAEKTITTSRQINEALRKQLEITREVQLSRLGGQHAIAVGMTPGAVIKVEGDAGDFFGALNGGASLTLNGNAGRFCGDTMFSGELIVNGDTGAGVGNYLRGGVVLVKGDCAGTAGALMKSGTILIDGKAGSDIGKYMTGGEIVVTGDAGEHTGENMMGGTIYLSGEPASLGLNARISKLTGEDQERLRYLHKQYRFKGLRSEEDLAGFQKVTAQSRRPFTGEAGK